MSDETSGDPSADGAPQPDVVRRTRPPRRPRPPIPRTRKIAIAVAVTCAVLAGAARIASQVIRYERATTPQAEGYRAYGTVDGTTFWLRANGADAFLLRTTGGFSSGCRYNGPDLDNPRLTSLFGDGGYLTVCTVSGLRGPKMIVDLVRDSAGPATIQLSDGSSVTQAGWIAPSRATPGLLPSEQLDVLFVDRADTTVESTTFG